MSIEDDALERRLAARRLVGPPAELRQRVLATVRTSLRATPGPATRFSRFALATAAVVLVGINLSMSLSLDTDYRLTAAPSANERAVGALRQLWPDATEHELERQAILIRASQQWAPIPAPSAFLFQSHDF